VLRSQKSRLTPFVLVLFLISIFLIAYFYPRWDFGGSSSAQQYCYNQYMDEHPDAGERDVPNGYALWIPFTPWFICDVFKND
jgi:hypothetical protein